MHQTGSVTDFIAAFEQLVIRTKGLTDAFYTECFTGYYSKFVQNYGKIVGPLTKLINKNSFAWNEAAKHEFETFK